MASDKHLTWKTSFLLALASAKRVSELHGLSFWARHSHGWSFCTFFLPDFVAKTQNPSVPDSHFEDFSVPSLDDFVGGDRDEPLFCPIRALCKYLFRTEQYHPGIESLFILMGRQKILVSRNTISFWLRSVITLAHASALEEDCRSLRVRAHEVRKVAMSLLFERNCTVHQVLKTGNWSAQSSFSSFYLRNVTHRHFNIFSIGPVVVAQQVMQPANPFGSSVVTFRICLSRLLYLCHPDLYILRFVMFLPLLLLLSLFSSDFGLRELQKPYTHEPLVGTWSGPHIT